MKTTAVLSFAAMFVCAALVIQCSDGGTVVEVDEGDGAATVRDSGGTGQSDAGSGGGRDTGAEDAVASDGGTGDAGHEDGGTGDAGTADDFGLVDGGADAGTLCGRNGGYCAASADACDSGFVDGPVLGCPGGKCCLPAKTDAGSGDGGTADSGSADTGAVDAGSADTGAPDSGTTDAGVSDGGAVDAGPAGTSRFGIGIHSPRSDLNAQIVDLGDIYVRLNLWDVAGWQNIKSQAMIAECEYCCDPVRSLNCSCAPGPNYCCAQGKYYFCTPASRNDRVEGEANADTFYGLQHDILFSV
ncbi:MAG: hypothetical protein HY897_03500, partial [Deltaproteobacteria bacterium]|nr:hypothetical protein [Deltaproteobacteria bacterium]